MANTIAQTLKYGLQWGPGNNPLHIEMFMIRKGGYFKYKGKKYGNGLLFHFTEAIKLLWPDVVLHRWNTLIIEKYLEHRLLVIIGPASCVGGETKILDPTTGEEPTIRSLYEQGRAPTVQTLYGPRKASVPFVKGIGDLFEVKLSNGARFVATGEHRVCVPDEPRWVTVSSLKIGQSLLGYGAFRPQSISESAPPIQIEGDLSCIGKEKDSQSDCRPYFRSGDEQLQRVLEHDPDAAPSPVDAPSRTHSSHLYDLAGALAHIHPDLDADRLSMLRYALLAGNRGNPSAIPACEEIPEPGAESFRQLSQCESATPHSLPSQPLPAHESRTPIDLSSGLFAFLETVQPVTVLSIRFLRHDVFFDLCVPGEHHYFAEGAIHHNSGKTHTAALCVTLDYLCFPHTTTVICCSTTKERLEDRVWGEIKKLMREAKARYSYLPGKLIQYRQRFVTTDDQSETDGTDFRNGMVGVPCMSSGKYAGLGSFAGLKNKRVRLLGDELSLLPRVFVDAISNLDKNPDFKAVGLGNPKDTTDALGVLAEPAPEVGGWESNIDQTPQTKTWPTKRDGGICIQLPGSDSPNLDGKLGIPLITQEQIDRDISFYGRDSLWYTMMDQGMMPRGQGNRRVLTRNFCAKHRAMEEPLWDSSMRTKVGFLDAAYRGVGGDRCIFGQLDFGNEAKSTLPVLMNADNPLISQDVAPRSNRQILCLVDLLVVPIQGIMDPEDQIVNAVVEQCQARGIPPENFFFDAGMRTALVSAFMRVWSTRVNSIDFGGTPSERPVSGGIDVACKDYYSKFVTELWFSVRLIVEAEQFRGMTEDVMMEGCAREWKMVKGNKIEVETKAEMKLKTGRSPDLFDALVTGVEGARRLGFKIASIAQKPAKVVAGDGEDWRENLRRQAKALWSSGALNHAA